MRYNKINIALLIFVFFGLSLSSKAQDAGIDYAQGVPNESYSLISDRYVYAVNELLQFVSYNQSPAEMQAVEWSKVLYLELITPSGNSVFKGKYEILNQTAKGSFIIPSNLVTGNYYLRVYTQWMRNFSPYEFTYLPVTIINPASEELLVSSKKEQDSLAIGKLTYDEFCQIKKLDINGGKVQVKIKLLDKIKDNKLTVSIIRKSNLNSKTINLKSKDSQSKIKFIPETRSTSISGTLFNKADSTPLAYRTINLTLFGEHKITYGAITREDGTFNFNIPKAYGERELFIAVQNSKAEEDPIIKVNNDFCNTSVSLPYIPFDQDSLSLAYYESLMVNSQLLQSYYGKHQMVTDTFEVMNDSIQFYGEPSLTLVFKDFIDLPNLSEYINELLVGVTVHKNKGIRRIKIQGTSPEMFIYEPLLMIDNVAMPDAETILALPTYKFKQIDVVNKPYIIGDIMYGGIVHFISKDNDLGGVDLPESGKFFSFKLFSEQVEESFPAELLSTDPNLRNTIYWNPALKISSMGYVNLSLEPKQAKGEFEILIQGINKEGESVYQSFPLELK